MSYQLTGEAPASADGDLVGFGTWQNGAGPEGAGATGEGVVHSPNHRNGDGCSLIRNDEGKEAEDVRSGPVR